MALVSISEAIKLSGVSRGTFYRKYLNEGVVSVTKSTDGKKQIDTAELLRVFGKLSLDTSTDLDNTESVQVGHSGQPVQADHSVRLELLQTKLAASEAQVKELQSDKQWLQSQVTNLTDSIKLLEAPKQDPQTYPRLWWQFWK